MKNTVSAAIAALSWSVRLAAAVTSNVYILDPQHKSPDTPPALSPKAARLVLAQRAGVEGYHEDDIRDQDVIDAINTYGVRTPIFGERDERKHVIVFVDSTREDNDELSFLKDHISFAISPSPNMDVTTGLWTDLAAQGRASDSDVTFKSYSRSKGVEKVIEHERAQGHVITVHMLSGKDDSSDADAWGTYTMPGAQSPLKDKRAAPQKEKPLEPTSSYAPVKATSAPANTYAASNNTTPLKGILPACFSSQQQCQSSTRNCTGHGQCSKKFTDSSSSDKSSCWTCQCSATKQTTSDGKTQTTYWGGPACQKKDVSAQFWLIALFTVGLVFLFGFAIGELFGMGNQELPSVIGAGVSGPVRRS
ncbi:hypothetical protein EJ03DRAFT_380878 [Teratosphaeria nubilosa]|uniref:Uncharacterized protein n=1 Tax=Teratosphaeria nubilosa TaxID=161662 RepID=A0A6G1LIU5_9PEZI|nr:hypothetical protein EJ03DRAFT_380878 [Teratosphaeria nubilosa]